MTLQGHIRDGQIVLDEPCALPEGAVVQIEVVGPSASEDSNIPSLYDRLKPIIGRATGLPADAASNVDHYLYGHPKQ